VERGVQQALERVGLGALGQRYPGQLSGGQQQRVALARSLVVEPSILLLDEPLSNLDAKLREMMRVELKTLQRETGITFVYVTHDQAEALALSDRIAVLHEGQLLQYGTPREVYECPASRQVADLVGRVNLLPGHLVERLSGRYGVVAINEAARLRTQVLDGAPPEVAVMVRPEDIRLKRELPAGGNVLRGSVLNRLYLGNLVEYQVATAGQEVRVHGPRDESFAPGDEVYVVLDEDRCLALA
jgi:iron(III) transport system ATP-binding protein